MKHFAQLHVAPDQDDWGLNDLCPQLLQEALSEVHGKKCTKKNMQVSMDGFQKPVTVSLAKVHRGSEPWLVSGELGRFTCAQTQ